MPDGQLFDVLRIQAQTCGPKGLWRDGQSDEFPVQRLETPRWKVDTSLEA